MGVHVGKMCQSVHYHLMNINRIRDFLDINSTKAIVHALVTSRMDYCNSLLSSLPAKTIRPLQITQNNAAREVSKSKKSDRITPILKSLHWLPVARRIEFKLACLIYKCLHGQAPDYLSSLLNVYTPPRQLRSSRSIQLTNHHLVSRTKFSDRAFSNSAPKIWNSLSSTTRNSLTFGSFRTNLKTELFKLSFS